MLKENAGNYRLLYIHKTALASLNKKYFISKNKIFCSEFEVYYGFLDVQDTQLVIVLVTQAIYNVSYPPLLLNILLSLQLDVVSKKKP